MIQAVVFDLFETLVTESTAVVQRASALAARLGVSPEAYRRHWRSLRPNVVLGRCSFRDALFQIAAQLGTTPADSLLEQLSSERASEKAVVLRTIEPDVRRMLAVLREKRLRLGLITNCFREDVASWDRSPLRPLFDVTVFSCAVSLAKPDPKVYLLACRELGVSPSHTLYVGDGADDELAGARTAGLSAHRALWFLSRWPQFRLAPDAAGLWHITDVLDVAA